jgi:geranylgeranyl diphosphate synthase type I
MGATLAGAKPEQIKKLYSYGMLLGRAFQIKDDIIGTFGTVKEIGKSNLTDIKEAKRTLLVWYAFNHAGKKDKLRIKRIMENKVTKDAELIKMRSIITDTGALAYAQKQIKYLYTQALDQIQSLNMNQKYKQTLNNFSKKILKT